MNKNVNNKTMLYRNYMQEGYGKRGIIWPNGVLSGNLIGIPIKLYIDTNNTLLNLTPGSYCYVFYRGR